MLPWEKMMALTDVWFMVRDGFDTWARGGLLGFSWWQVVLVTLAFTHLTIAATTIFLHRAQAHRSVDLGPIPSHIFRFWLWMTSGMVTKEWVAIHRKHHAKCETHDDPHSPQAHGFNTVMWTGAELYRNEAKNDETLAKYSHGVPNDWLERNVYGSHSVIGVSAMLIINLALFGPLGLSVWAIQMAWIPFWAAGVINGLGHWWGYRNFEAPDASTNVSPWGIVIGGEELHNNHHTYPTSAKFSVKPYEFDLGWTYIRIFEMLGMAKVRKTAPKLALNDVAKPVADGHTLEALIAHRYEVMAKYAQGVRSACVAELNRLREQGTEDSEQGKHLRLAKRWLHRDDDKIPANVKASVAMAAASAPTLVVMLAMREELRQLWTRTNVSAEQLVVDLQAWCRKAEESGIAALQEFSIGLRAARA
jgi:stearoyl-CoA desaturase (Delta-9 desaturase)